MPLLEVKDLTVEFSIDGKKVRPVDSLSFTLARGEVLGVVGESGSGKSMTALALLRLLDLPKMEISGEVKLNLALPELAVEDSVLSSSTQNPDLNPDSPLNLLKLSDAKLRKIRGNRIAMIFQEPMTSLNPVYSVGNQVAEVFECHQGLSKKESLARAVDLFFQVGISDPKRRVSDYPHQLSGGMRQRVMIAMALACNPDLLIADEPTTALDVTLQAQILELLHRLVEDRKMAMLLITHDLGVVRRHCDSVLVMYAGQMVEYARRDLIFSRPKHPYTLGLLESIPRFQNKSAQEVLKTIRGQVPSLSELPTGCHFQPRCDRACGACVVAVPQVRYIGEGQQSRCLNC